MTVILAISQPLWPLAAFLALAGLLAAAIVGTSYVLGQRHLQQTTGQPYEGGIEPTTSARLRVSARFYIMGMLFVIFDLEAAFIFAWAICVRQAGWGGYAGMAVFIFVLLVALIYMARQGVLDWGGPSPTASQSQGVS